MTFAGGLAGGGAGAGAGAGAVMSGRQFGGNDQDVSMLLSQSCPPPAAPIVHSLPAPTGFEMPDLRLPPPSPDALFMSGRPVRARRAHWCKMVSGLWLIVVALVFALDLCLSAWPPSPLRPLCRLHDWMVSYQHLPQTTWLLLAKGIALFWFVVCQRFFR